MSKAKPKPPAECLAIIVCESVVEDARTHNKCILNAYNSIQTLGPTARQDRLTVFLSLTGGHGELPLELRFGPENSNPVVKLSGKVKFASPLDVVDLVFDMRSVPLPKRGTYLLTARVSDIIVGMRRIMVLAPPEPKGGRNEC